MVNNESYWNCIYDIWLPEKNCRHFARPSLVSPRNDVWGTSGEIPYWWRITTRIWVRLLIGRVARKICFNQSQALPKSGKCTSSVWNWPLQRRCFIFLIVFFENIGERACEASARERAGSARKKNKELSSSPTTTSLRWRSINPLRFIFYHPCSTDFEGKIEGLWTG